MSTDTVNADDLNGGAPGFDRAPIVPAVQFTSSHARQSVFRRSLIRAVEVATG